MSAAHILEGREAKDRFVTLSSAWSELFDRLLLLLTILSLLISCVLISPKKELWVDEGYALQVITDRSTPHLLRALANGVDGGMPLYYLIAHGWSLLFGSTLLCLRLLTSLLICVGVLVLWNGMRRFYSAAAVAVGIPLTLLTSELLLSQNAEIRFYGLFFACAALVIVLHSRLSEGQASPKLIIGAVLANVALLLSHLFGVLYSGVGIAALVFSDYRKGHLRWRLYAALLSSWLCAVAVAEADPENQRHRTTT